MVFLPHWMSSDGGGKLEGLIVLGGTTGSFGDGKRKRATVKFSLDANDFQKTLETKEAIVDCMRFGGANSSSSGSEIEIAFVERYRTGASSQGIILDEMYPWTEYESSTEILVGCMRSTTAAV